MNKDFPGISPRLVPLHFTVLLSSKRPTACYGNPEHNEAENLNLDLALQSAACGAKLPLF
jgi:hypothetical protein